MVRPRPCWRKGEQIKVTKPRDGTARSELLRHALSHFFEKHN